MFFTTTLENNFQIKPKQLGVLQCGTNSLVQIQQNAPTVHRKLVLGGQKIEKQRQDTKLSMRCPTLHVKTK